MPLITEKCFDECDLHSNLAAIRDPDSDGDVWRPRKVGIFYPCCFHDSKNLRNFESTDLSVHQPRFSIAGKFST